MITRRRFLSLSRTTALALALQGCSRKSGVSPALLSPLDLISPIDRCPAPTITTFTGDDPTRGHAALWSRDAYLAARGGVPAPSEQAEVVVVGGGMSGLTTAFHLKDHRPLVLEQAPRFGGNSKGESWQGIDYSIGAAYLLLPEEGSEVAALLTSLGLSGQRLEEEDPVLSGGAITERFFDGDWAGSDTGHVRAVAEYLRAVWNEEGQVYPEIPLVDGENAEHVKRLDRVTFRRHLEQIAKRPLHPLVDTLIEQYCWSSFGASANEISAAAGLNFFTAEFGTKLVFPAGNATVAEALVTRLSDALPPQSLRTNALVVRIARVNAGVEVTYEDGGGALRTVLAQWVVCACPKFVVKRIVDALEPRRVKAIDRLRYRSYIVANLWLSRAPSRHFYDVYMLGEPLGRRAVREAAIARGATDVILANFSQHVDRGAVLTLYQGMPFEGARAELFVPGSFERVRAGFQSQIEREVLPALGLSTADVQELRLTRWGHPLPVAAAGLIADGVPATLRAPFQGRVLFAEQDSWALPAFETAVAEASYVAAHIRSTRV